MISILIPTRKRPDILSRLIESCLGTAKNPDNIQIIYYVDYDDASYNNLKIKADRFNGPRKILAEAWNTLCLVAKGPIYMLAGDDIVFNTPAWDENVLEAFDCFDDKIMYVHGDAVDYGAHGFLHQNWVTTVGYFVYPKLPSGYVDNWLNAVADIIERNVYVPVSFGHHMVSDDTQNNMMALRGIGDQIFRSSSQLIQEDADKLKEFINANSIR